MQLWTILRCFLTFVGSVTSGNLKVVTLSSGSLPDIGTPALVSALSVALKIFGEKYPSVCGNSSLHWESLNSGDTMCNDQPGTENTQNVLARLYGTGVLDGNEPTVIISTACASVFSSIANYASELDILAMPFVEADKSFQDKAKFPTLIQVSVMGATGSLLETVLQKFGWKYVVVINDVMSQWHGVGPGRRNAYVCAAQMGYLRDMKKLSWAEVRTDSNETGWAPDAMRRASDYGRIILSCTLGKQQRELAAAAFDLGMAGGDYVFVQFYFTEASFEPPLRCCVGDALDQKVAATLPSFLLLRTPAVDWRHVEYFTTAVAEYWRRNFSSTVQQDSFRGILGAEIIFNCVEGLEAIIQAIDATQSEPSNHFSGAKITNYVKNRTFRTISRSIQFSSFATRVNPVEIQQYNGTTKQFETVYASDPERAGLRLVRPSGMLWRNGTVPLDRPVCGTRGEHCVRRDWTVVALISTAVVLIASVPMVAFLLIRRRRNAVDLESWVINAHRIVPEDAKLGQDNTKKIAKIGDARVVCCLASGSSEDGLFRNPIPLQKNAKLLARLLYQISHLRHQNINHFIGIRLHPATIFQELCERGSLVDVFRHRADWQIRLSLFQDLVDGVVAIHSSGLQYHGNLKMTKCVVDKRFSLKIDDLGHERIFALLGRSKPVFRRAGGDPAADCPPCAECDVTALVNLGSEIFAVFGPAAPVQTVVLSRAGRASRARSTVSGNAGAEKIDFAAIVELRLLFEKTTSADTCISASSFQRSMTKILGPRSGLMQSLIKRLELHALQLEETVSARQDDLMQERKRCDVLLNEMLPSAVVRLLRTGEEVSPEEFDSATIYVSYVDGFAEFAKNALPLTVVAFLDLLYSNFDKSILAFDVYKLETISDSYLVASGLPIRNGQNHIGEVCGMALGLRRAFSMINGNVRLALQAGIHTGPAAAGVVGLKRPRYCIFGDTINTASRMASHGLPGKIHVSPQAKELSDPFRFEFEKRGVVFVKGKGDITTFWLVSMQRDIAQVQVEEDKEAH